MSRSFAQGAPCANERLLRVHHAHSLHTASRWPLDIVAGVCVGRFSQHNALHMERFSIQDRRTSTVSGPSPKHVSLHSTTKPREEPTHSVHRAVTLLSTAHPPPARSASGSSEMSEEGPQLGAVLVGDLLVLGRPGVLREWPPTVRGAMWVFNTNTLACCVCRTQSQTSRQCPCAPGRCDWRAVRRVSRVRRHRIPQTRPVLPLFLVPDVHKKSGCPERSFWCSSPLEPSVTQRPGNDRAVDDGLRRLSQKGNRLRPLTP